MNSVEGLKTRLEERFPDLKSTLLVPATRTGSWWLDIALEGQSLTVEWRPREGFGLSVSPFGGYGEGPDETYSSADAAFERIESILLSKEGVKDQEFTLGEIRAALRRSQSDVGRALGVAQNAVSKLERRTDVRVSSIAAFLGALGGRLQLRALFPGWTVTVRLGDDAPAKADEIQPLRSTPTRTTPVGRTGRAPSSRALTALAQNQACGDVP